MKKLELTLIIVVAFAGLAFCESQQISTEEALGTNSNHDVPYQALVMVRKDKSHPDHSTFCSAILVHEKWVLTTTACEVKRNSKVIFGSDKWCFLKGNETKFKYDAGREARAVSRIVKHLDLTKPVTEERDEEGDEDEDEEDDDDDEEEAVVFVLAELKRKVNLTDHIQIAKLATTEPQDKETYNVSGWGIKSLSCDVTGSCNLKISPHTTMTKAECEEQLPGFKLTNDEFCAGSFASGQGPCTVHEGSPLAKNGEVFGLAAAVNSYCEGPDLPSVYLKVAGLKDWIDSTTKTQ